MKNFFDAAQFRAAAPYIFSFKNKIFVIAFGGEVLLNGEFQQLAEDLNLLTSLGIQIVLVYGARPQIEARLASQQIASHYVEGMRVTDEPTLDCVKQVVGALRFEIEARLSLGLPNSPMAGGRMRIASGNYVLARPLGVRQGVDLQYSGSIRRVDAASIKRNLAEGEIVLLSPLGYSITGEVFNLTLEEVATQAAIALQAEKLIFLVDEEADHFVQNYAHEMTVPRIRALLDEKQADLPDDLQYYLPCAVQALERDVPRVHLIYNPHQQGGLLAELFTHKGIGMLITKNPLQNLRHAHVEDIQEILRILAPLEAAGILVRRSRERLEMEIEHFCVQEHDGKVVGCAALYPFFDESMGELACLAVDQDFRHAHYGDALLQFIETKAKKLGLSQLFVLTTQTAHWFIERGFIEKEIESLPARKKALYNYQRMSKVFFKKVI